MPNSKTLVQTILAAFCAILCALSSLGGGSMNRRRILASLGGGRDTYDYQVDYVGCNNGGTKLSYFDSGVKLNVQTDEVEIKYIVMGYPNASNGMWGNFDDDGTGLHYFGENMYWQTVRCYANGEIETAVNMRSRAQQNAYTHIACSKSLRRRVLVYDDWIKEYVNTIYENKTLVTSDYQFNETCPIMTLRSGGTLYNNYYFRIHSFIVKRNGVLIRDFIPVVKYDVGYLFDNVEGKLYPMLGNGVQVIGNRVDVAA